MIRLALAAACLLVTSPVLAQTAPPAPPPAPPAGDAPLPPPEPTPTPPPTPPAPVRPVPTRDLEPEQTPPAPAPPTRPTAFSIGVGVGYRFPTSLQMPNATSVRFRTARGLTVEPTVVLASSSREVDVGTSTTTSATELGAGVLARFPLVRQRRTELELLAGIELDRLDVDAGQDGNGNTTPGTTTTTTKINYGLAVGVWVTPYLQLSLSATNAIVDYTHVREEMDFSFVTVTNTTTFGIIFDPQVSAMVHLYY